MKTASETNHKDIRLDRGGEIDVEYYMHKARVMRAAYLASAFVDIRLAIKGRIIEFYQKFICPKCQPSH